MTRDDDTLNIPRSEPALVDGIENPRADDPRVDVPTLDDLDAVTELWVELARGQRRHGSTLLAAGNRSVVRERVARSIVTGELLVARTEPEDPAEGESRDAQLVGFVGFSIERGGYERDHTRGTVTNLYVRPPGRGEGIGSALLAAAETVLADAGAETVALEVLVDNDRARSFYAEHGYEPNRIELEKPLDGDSDREDTERGDAARRGGAVGDDTGATEDDA